MTLPFFKVIDNLSIVILSTRVGITVTWHTAFTPDPSAAITLTSASPTVIAVSSPVSSTVIASGLL